MALPTFFTKLFSSYGNAPRIKESVTLPAQASQNGKFLKTDGTNTAWDSIPEYADATTSAHGLMSASDKTKLDGIGEGANVQSVNGQTGAVTVSTSMSWTYYQGTIQGSSSISVTGFTIGKYCPVVTSNKVSVQSGATELRYGSGSSMVGILPTSTTVVFQSTATNDSPLNIFK